MFQLRTYRNSQTGEELTAVQWGKKLGINPRRFRSRYHDWGDDPKTFLPKIKREGLFTHPLTGETLSGRGWEEKLGLGLYSFGNRLRRWGADSPRTYEEENGLKIGGARGVVRVSDGKAYRSIMSAAEDNFYDPTHFFRTIKRNGFNGQFKILEPNDAAQ